MVNVEGDYRLKVTGDCHIEVGGGFFMDAVGAAKQVDKNGKPAEDKDKVQKHTITFNSDLDMNVSGSTCQLQASKIKMGAKKFEGILDDYSLQTEKADFMCKGDTLISSMKTITNTTPNMFNYINKPVDDKAKKPGITTVCYGQIITDVLPASPHMKVPPIVTTNLNGPINTKCGATGMKTDVVEGGHFLTVEGDNGAVHNITKNYSIEVGGNMDTDVTGTFRVTAKTIYLN